MYSSNYHLLCSIDFLAWKAHFQNRIGKNRIHAFTHLILKPIMVSEQCLNLESIFFKNSMPVVIVGMGIGIGIRRW